MRLLSLGALALAATAHAYLDSSPFFIASSSDFLFSSPQLTTHTSVEASLNSALVQCPSDLYIVVSQSGVKSSDFSEETTPNLHHLISSPDSGVRSSASIKDVVGKIDVVGLRTLLGRCSTWSAHREFADGLQSPYAEAGSTSGLVNVFLQGPGTIGAPMLTENDAYFGLLVEQARKSTSNFTIIYTTTPPRREASAEKSEEYVMEDDEVLLQEPLHMDLRRDLDRRAGGKIYENQTLVDGPLFEKYQFLSPGIFMGFTVGLILLSILYVGLSALSSLQVTYAAFDKEMGQLASKKAQ